jgi:integrase
LNEALRKELVARNVAALAKPPGVAKAELETFTPDQARLFLAAASGHLLEALFTVALAIGLRHGEALALLDSDLDLTAGTLRVFRTLQRLDGSLQRVETKSENGRRMVPLPESAWKYSGDVWFVARKRGGWPGPTGRIRATCLPPLVELY